MSGSGSHARYLAAWEPPLLDFEMISKHRRQILARLRSLCDTPRPQDCVKLEISLYNRMNSSTLTSSSRMTARTVPLRMFLPL